MERAPSGQSWNNLTKKIDKVILNYNSKYKMNIHEPILTDINKLLNKETDGRELDKSPMQKNFTKFM